MRPGKPNDDPKSKPEHDDYDPFHLPMPTLKTGAPRRWPATLGVCPTLPGFAPWRAAMLNPLPLLLGRLNQRGGCLQCHGH